MTRPYALLRAGFPYVASLGMRRMTDFPIDVVIGDEGRLYVLSRSDLTNQIRKLNWNDDDLGTIGGKGTDEGKFIWPTSMIRDREENLYVSDEALHRISAFSRQGEFLGVWGKHGHAEGELDRPSGIAFDADEDVYVSDTLNHRVQKFTKDGTFLSTWGSFGRGEGELDMPWGITVDELGDVYVVDWRNDRVQKFSADGEFILAFGASGSEDGRLNRPVGVAVDSDGDIYVADQGNDRVQQFDATGRYVDKFIGDATLGKAARTYVMSNAKVLRVREMTTLEESRRLRAPSSVKLDDQNRLYIADYGKHRIQVYKKEAYPLTPDEIMEEPASPSLSTV